MGGYSRINTLNTFRVLEYIKALNKNHQVYVHLVLLFLLILYFIIALLRLDYPLLLAEGDGMRDYLVGNHIAYYGEHILSGTLSSGTSESIKNSPLYFYILAAFLLIDNSFLFLGLVNIIFIILTLLLIYLIAARAFGIPRGIFAVIFYTFTPFVLDIGKFISPNNIAQTLTYFSFFLLLSFYLRKKYLSILLSYLTLAFAVLIHNSALAVLPFFLIITAIILIKQKRAPQFYLYPILVFSVTLFIFYIPTLFINDTFSNSGYLTNILVESLEDIFLNLKITINNLFYIFSLYPSHVKIITLGVIFLSTLLYFIDQKIDKRKKILVLILLGFILQQVFFIILLKKSHAVYILPVLGFLPIIVAEIMLSNFYKNLVMKLAGLVVIVFLFWVFSNKFSGGRPFPSSDYKKFDLVSSASNKIIKEVKDIEFREGYRSPDFFRVESYHPHAYYSGGKLITNFYISDAVLIAPIEDKMNRKLISITSTSKRFVQTNSDDYVFIVCFYESIGIKDLNAYLCKEEFNRMYGQHHITKDIFSSEYLTIKLAKRNE